MGAYENPPLIIQPNYGEIFAQNAQNIIAIAEQRKKEKEQEQKEKEVKFLQASERKTEYARRATNLKAGALTENVNQIGLELTDKYFVNEDLFAKGEITAEEYATNKSKYESVLNGISSTGTTIREFEAVIKDMELSNFQPGGEVLGLIKAYKEGRVDAEIIDGRLELKYEVDGKVFDVDEGWLSNPNSWNVVEKFDSDPVTDGLAEGLKKQITDEASRTIQTDDAKITTSEQRYSKAYGTVEDRRNQLLSNSIVRDLDQNELGSYYKDRIVPNMSGADIQSLNEMLNSENYSVLTDDQKNKIKSIVQNGDWSNEKIKVGDQEVNISSVLTEFSRRRLVEEAMNKVPAPATRTATALDQRTPAPEKPGKDPVEQRTGFNKQERINAVNKILALEPEETFEIKFQGTNDFEKENYEMIKNPDGTISYRIKPSADLLKEEKKLKPEERGKNPKLAYIDISAADLFKEFGVEDLVEEQPKSIILP